MSPVLIRFNKSKKPGVLGGMTCIRDDGTEEYQPLAVGPGFIAHDLTHYAVETTLGLRESFFGLVARGHSIGQITQVNEAWRDGTPVEAIQTEFMVSIFQAEVMGEVQPVEEAPSARELNEVIARACESRGLPAPRALAEDEVRRVRAVQRELLERWRGVPAGGVMELAFELRGGPSEGR